MAYISHSPFDYRSLRERAEHVSLSLLVRSAFVAVAAAIAILALSEAYAPASVAAPLAVKTDRLGASTGEVKGDTGVVSVDVAAMTTTVERGTVAELSPASPTIVGAR